MEINFPDEKLKLSELPKWPGQSDQPLALKNDEEEDSGDQDTSGKTEAGAKGTASVADSAGPQGRYIAPEMQSFTRVFRLGHDLSVPTRVGDAPSKLFLLGTGALTNAISPAAAREVTKVSGDPEMFAKASADRSRRSTAPTRPSCNLAACARKIRTCCLSTPLRSATTAAPRFPDSSASLCFVSSTSRSITATPSSTSVMTPCLYPHEPDSPLKA